MNDRQTLYEYILIGVLSVIILLFSVFITFTGEKKKLAVTFSKILEWPVPAPPKDPYPNLQGLAMDPAGYVWAAEHEACRIEKFTHEGKSVMVLGKQGQGKLQFEKPDAVAVDSKGNIFVADTWNHRIQKISKSGQFLAWWGTKKWQIGVGDGEFFGPRGVAVDSAGNVYVTDTGNHRVQKFDNNGKFIKWWGGKGAENDRLNEPVGIAVDDKNFIYVADTHNRAIKKYNSDGGLVGKWPIEGWNELRITTMGFLACDGGGRVYASDNAAGISSVYVFADNGAFVGEWKKDNSQNQAFFGPSGLAADLKGGIFVADSNNRIQRFSR